MATTLPAADAPAGGERAALMPLANIKVVEGFNPRTTMERAALEQLAASIAEVGMLQPVRLGPADEDGKYPLRAGGRRYAAAVLADLDAIPYVIGDASEQAGGLDEALIENMVREDLTPIDEALGCQRLLDRGFTRKGVAQRLTKTQDWVRDRLQLLELPESLRPLVDDGSVPLKAVKPLVAIAHRHPGLATLAADVVIGSAAGDDEPWTWEDLDDDPVDVITRDLELGELAALPDDVFLARRSNPPGYPITRFTLTDEATSELPGLCDALGRGDTPETFQVLLGEQAIAQASALNATLASATTPWAPTLILGQDVADQLASDFVLRNVALVQERAAQEAAAAAARPAAGDDPAEPAAPTQAGGQGTAPSAGTSELAGPTEAEVAEQRRAERAAEAAKRLRIQEANLELGAAVYSRLSRLRVDERVVKILTAIPLDGDLDQIAARGARYGFPGWVTEETKGDKVKRTYLQTYEAGRKATEYLAGAEGLGDYAGRCIALIVMAHLADEDAVAMSNRVHHSVARTYHPYGPAGRERGLPWTPDVAELIEQLAIDRLPEAITAPLVAKRESARREAEERRQRTEAMNAALEQLLETLPSLPADERERACQAFRNEHGGHWKVADALRSIAAAEAAAAADPPAAQGAAGGDSEAAANGATPDSGDAVAQEPPSGQAADEVTDPPQAEGPAAALGTRSAAALALVVARPGITIPELAEAMDVRQNYLYRVMPPLADQGQVEKRGRGWFPAENAGDES